MALAPDIVDILTRATEGPQRRAFGAAPDRLGELFAEITRTILPRSFHFSDGPSTLGQANVTQGRIQSLAATAPGDKPGPSREEQLHQTARALVKLILTSDDLTVTVALSTSDTDPDDAAFSVGELSAACVALGFTHQSGHLTLPGVLAALDCAGACNAPESRELAAELSDLHALLGDEVLVHLPGKADQGLLVALSDGTAQVLPVRSADLDLALRLWRRRGGP